ncbi:putative E3 ubiquitin-protein ligase LIN-1 isoform X2 [Rhodamnia argentea]|uniref:E3 ubiquitin-protein ligase LIN-1 isoform X2 n=1 Tax=Rhodamnia argentea TaxID=178133 RepID=A0ABM3HIA7_9MYRT|nr:putative E3 ubiquitin-protein ligase LIN-1 isoform X2 [Rhodamnia argentea]
MSLPSPPPCHDHDQPDLESIRMVAVSVNKFIRQFLADGACSWNGIKSACISMLQDQKHEFFELSEHSVLSNLYWGIDNIEAAIWAEWPGERESRLRSSEGMLQVPALLDEEGTTSGIANRHLIAVSYFYLCVVKRLQGEDWQVAMHFLQALSVCPELVRNLFAPELCELLFLSGSAWSKSKKTGGHRSTSPVRLIDSNEEEALELMKRMARKFKGWLMYYQVMLYGETPQWNCGSREVLSLQNATNCLMNEQSVRIESSFSIGNGHDWLHDSEKVHPLYPGKESRDNNLCSNGAAFANCVEDSKHLGKAPKSQVYNGEINGNGSIRCLHDMLEEPQSDSSTSANSIQGESAEEGDMEEAKEDNESSIRRMRIDVELQEIDTYCRKRQGPCSTSEPECKAICTAGLPRSPRHQRCTGPAEVNIARIFAETLPDSFGDFNESLLELRDRKQNNNAYWNLHMDDLKTSEQHDHQLFNQIAATSQRNHRVARRSPRKSLARKGNKLCVQNKLTKEGSYSEKPSHHDLMGIFEKAVSQLCFSEGMRKLNEENIIQITAIYETLNDNNGVKHAALKDVLLDQLLQAISTSKEERVIRMSVSILTTIALTNQSVLGDIRKKGLQLRDLASALKRNVHEAAILIYLINPSPTEIKTLELLPNLVEIVCTWSSYKLKRTSVLLTPPMASLMIIEMLVTAFDNATNSTHLAALNSPKVLHGLLDVARDSGAEESISLARIIVKCMQFDGQCRVYVSQSTPISPFISLLQNNKRCAKFIALEFFHEILCMPRSAANSLLQRIRNEGGADIMNMLMLCVQNLESHHQLFAANLLLQLDTLENQSGGSMFVEEAMKVLLESLTPKEDLKMHQLSAFILANLGGTYSWTGEPYTVAWLVRKVGLASAHHRNLIKDFNWEDQCLLDSESDSWCGKIARNIIKIGNPVFRALETGLKSKTKRVSRDSLTAIAWLGCEIAKSTHTQRYSACEILLDGLEQFLHPGVDLEERLLACFSIYNYASGKGMQKLIHFSEGVRESLRRFSNITWMAEELHRVADFYLPNKSRISCVHTQILEAGHSNCGAVNALIYYKGLLCSGHSDGSIKMWDIKGQSSTLVLDKRQHKKEVTCFSLFEQGESLLSGSADKTIKVWKLVQRKLECSEVISLKDPICRMDTLGDAIFAIIPGHGIKVPSNLSLYIHKQKPFSERITLKNLLLSGRAYLLRELIFQVIDASRTVKEICKSKNVKSICVIQGKIYAGCKDSSVQEIILANYREREIKAPLKSWMMQKRPINSIVSYKDWMYTSSAVVHGSNFKEWRRNCEAEMRIALQRGANVLAMGVVEDFIYLNCSSSTSALQIWLRGTAQKVGRISAGGKITSLLTANDVVICGTEAGLIKGWIPL